MQKWLAPGLCGAVLISCASIAVAQKPVRPPANALGVQQPGQPISDAVPAERQARIDAFNAHFRETHGGQGPEQFGIQCCQTLQIPASAFQPVSSGEVWTYDTFGYIYPAAFGTNFYDLWAPVQLPSGSLVSFLDIYYGDTDPINDIGAELWEFTGILVPGVVQIATAYSSGSNGFGLASSAAFSYTVNNYVGNVNGAQLSVFIYTSGNPGNTREFKSVSLYWARQVSPAPATQTFNDVAPADFGYQYIEALAASGITGGCGGGNYCPNGTLTRAQMAIFLSKALGLYWAF